MDDYFECTDATCPFATNSPKQVRQHVLDTGHTVVADDLVAMQAEIMREAAGDADS